MRLLLCFLAVCLFASTKAVAAEKKPWTFLFYVAGDEEEIDPWERVSLRKLEQIGSDEMKWLVAHADFAKDDEGKGIVSEPARRYEIRRFPGPYDAKDYKSLALKSPIVWKSTGETNSADPKELQDFIAWGVKNYPADHYALFFLTHSWGWRGLAQDYNPGVPLPKSPAGVDIKYLMMPISGIRQAIAAGLPPGRRLDILGMDSCNSAVLEFAYEMRDLAHYFTAAVTEMPFMGFTYDLTFARGWHGGRNFVRQLAADTVASFARGGGASGLEGNYPAVSIVAVDFEKMAAVWEQFAPLAQGLKGSNFKDLFLGAKTETWQDAAHNADLSEVAATLVRQSSLAEVRDRAGRVLALLGEPNPSPAPDGALVDVKTAGIDTLRITFEGDENGDEKDRLKEGQDAFAYQNPHLKTAAKGWAWSVKTESPKVRTYAVQAPWKAGEALALRPYLPGTSWVTIETLLGGKVVESRKLTEPRTFYARTEFPHESPYFFAGHTFGAARNNGLGLSFDVAVDTAHPEAWSWQGGRWIGGRDYYRTITFARAFGWADLLFQ